MEFLKQVQSLSFEGNIAENWKKFEASYDIFEIAAEIGQKSEPVKIAIFLNAIGEEGVELFATLDLKEADKVDYAKVKKAFESYCVPKKNVVYDRFIFYSRIQKDGEPFKQFLQDIKKLAKTCEFGEQQNSMMRNRIVLGVNDKKLQEKMLQMENLTFEKSVDCCKASEISKTQTLCNRNTSIQNGLKQNSKNSAEIIRKWIEIFTTYGIPKTIIADNVPFNSFECKEYAKRWDIEIITSSPLYPKSNGLAERAVQIVKNIFHKCDTTEKIQLALLEYRNTPVKDLSFSPAQLVMNRRLRTKIPIKYCLLKPKINENITEQMSIKQQNYKKYYDKSAKNRKDFKIGDKLWVQRANKWIIGRIIRKCNTPRSFIIKIFKNGAELRRNSSHLRICNTKQYIENNFEFHEDISDSNIEDNTQKKKYTRT